MGYIGNQQTEGYSQVPPKQDLTGATGTTLTLSNAVASAEGIDLFINNVRQEPTTAYSVGGDGVTVTLTGSVVATDDIYVVYNSLARQTSTHPSNQALQATSGTFSGAVSAASASVTGNLTVDTNTLYVDSTNNRVGVGTVSPVSTMDINGLVSFGGSTSRSINYRSGDNDILYEFDAGDFYRQDIGNSTHSWFTGNSERMRIDSSGRLLLNATVNNVAFSSARSQIRYSKTGEFGLHIRPSDNDTGGGQPVLFQNYAGGTIGSIGATASATSYNTSSDYRLKTDVTYDWDATSRLKQLKPARFAWIVDGDDAVPVDGFLAHEVQSVVPEAISGTKDAVDDEGNPVYQGIDQSKLVPLLVKTIQELEARITALEAN